jgi:hypothetical protein
MLKRLLAFLVFALSCSILTFAQSNRGGISGTVFDASGAVIPGATVTITNVGTNQEIRVITSESGAYSVPLLEPVTYNVTVEIKGFKKSVLKNVKVDTAIVATVNVTLETGELSTEIVVQAETAPVIAESGVAADTITERQIRDVPLVNRSVLDLALTLPNVSGDAGTENPAIVAVTTCPGCNLSLNGGRPMNTLMLADGANNTGVSLARTMVSFSPETVQEFTVQTSTYSAEFGGTGGGIINATTKSGGNQFRGTALWYNRNPAVAAAPWTMASANRPQPTLKYNYFSLAAGGPVYIPKIYNGKNRTFWFAAFEPNYRRDHLDQYGLLPTDAMRKGDFSGLVNATTSGWLPQDVVQKFQSIAPNAVAGTDSAIYQNYNVVNGNQFTIIPAPTGGKTYVPFPGNIIPTSLLDASALKAMKYIIPASSYYLDSNGRISNVVVPRLLLQDEKRYTVRIDQVINNKNQLFGRYTATPIVKTQSAPVSPTTNGAEYSWAKQVMLADTHAFRSTMINELRVNYTRGRFSNTAAPEYDAVTGQNLNTELGLPNITKGGVPLLGGLFPGSSLGGGGSTATGLGSGGSTSVEDREERYGITNTFFWQHGKMSWKFGVDLSKALQNVTPLFAALGGSYSFSSIQTNSIGSGTGGTGGSPFASFLLGVPNGSVTLRSTMIPYYYRWNSMAAFVQNDWKVRPNLTLNLGLRYNLEMPRTEKYNNQGVFRPDLAQSVPLPSSLTLQNGQVITSTLAPPFVFAGRGGNSRYLTPPQYLNFEPRFGFAWSPGFLEGHRVTIRGGYGLSHAPISGMTRLPQPDFGATQPFASTVPSNTVNPTYVMRLGENPPLITPTTPDQAINAPSNGVVTANSLYYQSSIGGFAVSPNYHTPYIQNWSLIGSWQMNPTTVLEIAYVGNKGTHLFMPHENINPKNIPMLQAQIAANVNTAATINDPLGRINPANGRVLTVQNGSLGSPYLGFSTLYMWYDSAANSARHAGYINVVHRVARGLIFSANYTYAKSMDDASSSGGDKNILTPVGGQVDGQVSFGGTRRNDRSVSTYDMRHVINGTYIYDLPIGRGRALGGNLWKPLDYIAGGWTTSGVIRLSSGFPMMATLSDTNLLGDLTHTIRPDLVPGVPLVNPLWDRSCPTGNGCQPYLNPAAFMRPALGSLGTAPRTMDSVRGPWAQTFDAAIYKDFGIGENRRIQFRADLLNAFNHPVFRVYPNNAGGTDLFNNAPSTTALSAADYNTWATANNKLLSSTTGGTAMLNQINAMVNTYRAGGTANGALPLDFFRVPLPQNFYGPAATAYDITNIDGYKLFRLRQQWNTSGGDLYQSGLPRFIQFGVKIFF